MKSKKSQIMEMPFVFIFSLILVAVVIFVGFFVINNFLEKKEQASINLFVAELKNKVEEAAYSEEAAMAEDFDFSKKFKYVCFANLSKCKEPEILPADVCKNCNSFCNEIELRKRNEDNLFLLPLDTAKKYNTFSAWHISCNEKECLEIEKTICIPVVNGKVKIRLTKPEGKRKVAVSAA